ncbi:c6 domain-containing protein [Ditylenchus destructor]|nr:c6 domain-containing protein [Ditylenchus destructor]
MFLQWMLATLVICILVLPERGQSCHPPAPATPGLSDIGATLAAQNQANTAAQVATAGTTVATTTSATCNTCDPNSLVTLTSNDAVNSGIPAANVVSVARPTFTMGTDANGCSTLSFDCTPNQAEIRVGLEMSGIQPDWGNALSYTLTCKNNGRWYVSNGTPQTPLHGTRGNLPAWEPALCGETTLGITDCIVQGVSCVTRT